MLTTEDSFDISKALESVRQMLDTAEGRETASNILNMFGADAENRASDEADNSEPPASTAPFGSVDAEMLSRLKTVLSVVNSTPNNAQTEFLNALKPFLTRGRREKTDQAIKILNTARALKLLKNMEGGG